MRAWEGGYGHWQLGTGQGAKQRQPVRPSGDAPHADPLSTPGRGEGMGWGCVIKRERLWVISVTDPLSDENSGSWSKVKGSKSAN